MNPAEDKGHDGAWMYFALYLTFSVAMGAYFFYRGWRTPGHVGVLVIAGAAAMAGLLARWLTPVSVGRKAFEATCFLVFWLVLTYA